MSSGAHLKTGRPIGAVMESGSGSKSWAGVFGDYRYEVQRIIDCGGDDVLVEAIEIGRGASSGAEVRSTNFELLTIREGMIVRIREFYDEGPALEAAGLSE